MELKEFKEKTQSKVVDIIANLGVFTLSEIMDIEDIREAKKSFDELSDLINEYIEENDKPKFEVGDYVTLTCCNEKIITKIDEIKHEEILGVWYDKSLKTIKEDVWFINNLNARHATQEEKAEYKAALNFHEHGRKPFEVKEGDLVNNASGNRMIVENPYMFVNELFYVTGYDLLATAEELEAWLSDGKTEVG